MAILHIFVTLPSNMFSLQLVESAYVEPAGMEGGLYGIIMRNHKLPHQNVVPEIILVSTSDISSRYWQRFGSRAAAILVTGLKPHSLYLIL